MNVLDLIADITWAFGMYFILETSKGIYIWSSPSYGGDNTIRRYYGSFEKCMKEQGIPFGRDKGRHRIGDYVDKNVILKGN